MREGTCLEQDIIKYGTSTNNTNNDKTKCWSRNKNVTIDGVVDACIVNKTQPIVSLQGPIQSSSQNKSPHIENNTVSTNAKASQATNTRFPRMNAPRRNYTPLGEPIELELKKLI